MNGSFLNIKYSADSVERSSASNKLFTDSSISEKVKANCLFIFCDF